MAADGNSEVLATISELTEVALATYAVNPRLVEEHANGERRIHQGGYGDRQLFELVQNAADELRERALHGGRIEAVLTESHLYCANEGSPITPQGADTILRMGVSRKRGGQIGRFGVGVKSVLSVTRAPQFFSSTGAFGFDADWSAQEIRTAVNKALTEQGRQEMELDDTPVLRLARPLDVSVERAADSTLDTMLQWATTVVRLPLIAGAAVELARSMHEVKGTNADEFPTLFQLFSPHVGTIFLEDRSVLPAIHRELRVREDDVVTAIHQSRSGSRAAEERYTVFTVAHAVSDEVREKSGELHDRATLDVSWAVPEYRIDNSGESPLWTVPAERGMFWSYFPTKYPTTLSGALNSAWKTNEDRQNLLDSADLNRELLDVSAKLIIDSLPALVVEKDPAAYLALLPGRTKESPNWACKYLTAKVWDLASTEPSLPDQDGQLRRLPDLQLRPEAISQNTLKLWSEYPDRPKDWVHHSVDASPLRRGKMSHILEQAPSRKQTSVAEWLEALVENRSVDASMAALKVLHRVVERDRAGDVKAIAEAKRARIVLTTDGEFVEPTPGRVFRRTSDDVLRDDLVYVDDRLADDQEMARILDQLGIRDADAEGRFHSILDQGFRNYTSTHWTQFWELLRAAGGASQIRAVSTRVEDPGSVLMVKTMSGTFALVRTCLLPGPIVPTDGSRDADVTVDMRFHADDYSFLRAIGAKDRPDTSEYHVETDGWFTEYQEAMYKKYCASLPSTSRPVMPNTLRFEGAPVAGPLSVFKRLSDEGKAAFIAATPADGVVTNWTRQVGRNSTSRVQIPSPIRWLFTKHGYVDTSQGICRVAKAVGPELASYSSVLPVAQIPAATAQRLRLRSTVDEIPSAQWATLLSQVKKSEDDEFIGRTYALLIRVANDLLDEEPSVRCRVGARWELRPDGEVAVTTKRTEFDELVRQGQPALLVIDPVDTAEAEYMVEQWGMLRYDAVIEKEVKSVLTGSASALTDSLPAFKISPGQQALRGYSLQECSELDEITRTPAGTTRKPLQSARDGDVVLVRAGMSGIDRMVAVDSHLGFGIGRTRCDSLIAHHHKLLQSQQFRDKIAKIRDAPSITAKLAHLLTAAQLRAGLPEGLMASEIHETGHDPSPSRIAELAYSAFDEGVLREYSSDIRAEYANAPAHFDGTAPALRFVTDLKFPDSFAGARVPAPPEREEAHGPVDFPALHPYQDEVARRFVDFLSEPLPSRSMLSLPTGAGKTRVAAEAVIRWIRDSGMPDGPILWIAQTTELCEQAVQSWRFVWEQVGPPESLVLDRLWTSNSSSPVTRRPHLVVATDAKLAKCLGSDEYEWLRMASLVIVDEAHTATSKEYTRIFELLGLTRSKTHRNLVGLTATPFRNTAELSNRLAGRFGNQRLDEGVLGDNPVLRLQELGVLSRVEHRELPGARLELNRSELADAAKMGIDGVLPKSAERRLAADESRNAALLNEIEKMPADWPVLVFATSVDHARVLAAKLSDRGIRSVAIDSATPLPDRRRRIEEFRNKRVRVITNYGVLSQGFDAPATRAVVIARPVYSANIYQQMVGRGLRGIKNGGKDECLILDVKDNITNFDNKLAFNEFEYLWNGG